VFSLEYIPLLDIGDVIVARQRAGLVSSQELSSKLVIAPLLFMTEHFELLSEAIQNFWPCGIIVVNSLASRMLELSASELVT